MAWYVVTIRRISRASRSESNMMPNYNMGGLAAVFRMWAWAPVGLGMDWLLCHSHILSTLLIIITILSAYSFVQF